MVGEVVRFCKCGARITFFAEIGSEIEHECGCGKEFKIKIKEAKDESRAVSIQARDVEKCR